MIFVVRELFFLILVIFPGREGGQRYRNINAEQCFFKVLRNPLKNFAACGGEFPKKTLKKSLAAKFPKKP